MPSGELSTTTLNRVPTPPCLLPYRSSTINNHHPLRHVPPVAHKSAGTYTLANSCVTGRHLPIQRSVRPNNNATISGPYLVEKGSYGVTPPDQERTRVIFSATERTLDAACPVVCAPSRGAMSLSPSNTARNSQGCVPFVVCAPCTTQKGRDFVSNSSQLVAGSISLSQAHAHRHTERYVAVNVYPSYIGDLLVWSSPACSRLLRHLSNSSAAMEKMYARWRSLIQDPTGKILKHGTMYKPNVLFFPEQVPTICPIVPAFLLSLYAPVE